MLTKQDRILTFKWGAESRRFFDGDLPLLRALDKAILLSSIHGSRRN